MPESVYIETGYVRGLSYYSGHSRSVQDVLYSGLIVGTLGDRVKAKPGGEFTPAQARAAAALLIAAADAIEGAK